MSDFSARYVYAASSADVLTAGSMTVQVIVHIVALFIQEGAIYAVDNRCSL